MKIRLTEPLGEWRTDDVLELDDATALELLRTGVAVAVAVKRESERETRVLAVDETRGG